MTDIRTFRASSVQQALQQVRAYFGPQAAVLHTRQINRGMLGWLVGPQVEVTASNEFQVPSRLGPAPAPPTRRPETENGDDAELRLQLEQLQSMVQQLVTDQVAPEHEEIAPMRREMVEQLTRLDFPASDVARILDEAVPDLDGASDGEDIEQPLRDYIAGQIAPKGPIQVDGRKPHVVALVGPTGVGKTTTIAKLAANHHLREQHRVGLITVDTYRIAAVEQLQTYAEIIDLPMEVVATPREMQRAVSRFANMDLVLIDTAGRSPRDDIRLRELNAVIQEAQPDEIQLVLSAVSGATSLSESIATFGKVGVTSLLFTKLDEAPTLGGLWPALKSQIPISYVTDGQNVPDDIALVDPQSLAFEMLARSVEAAS